ncbi:MAG: hypothetical protein HC906_02680 [Bacteroidales bacterium]|nr:hypothetical protein [Bacteroidales bacterium]
MINRLIEDHGEYFWKNDFTSNEWHVEIEMISEKSARISDHEKTYDYDIIHKNGILYFQSKDTMVNFGTLSNERLKYAPLYMIPSPIIIGPQKTIYIPCFYAKEENGSLYFPMVSYIENLYDNNGGLFSSMGIGNYNNEFNPTYLNKIQIINSIKDTVVYQNNRVVFREK